jgi:hypothetical protein
MSCLFTFLFGRVDGLRKVHRKNKKVKLLAVVLHYHDIGGFMMGYG